MSEDPRLGTTLADRYRLNDLLGSGGMGRVYAAEHVLMKKKLAVKVLHRELTTVPDVVKRFVHEARALAHCLAQAGQHQLDGDAQGTAMTVTYQGEIESNSAIKGTVDLGGLGTGTFTGKRVK